MLGIAPGEWNWLDQMRQNPFGKNPILSGGVFKGPQINGGVFGSGAKPEHRDALMAAAATLLSGSGYSPQRRTFGELMGQAMMSGQQARAQSQDRAMQQKLQEAQLAALEQKQAQQSPFGTIDPDQFTPESLAKFQQSGNFADLVPQNRGGADTADMQNFRFWQSLTPEQQKQFQSLQRQPTAPQLSVINGVPTLVNRMTGETTPLSNQQSEIDALVNKSMAESQARATGTAEGEIAGGIQKKGAAAKVVKDTLDLADPLIDIATGSVTGAAMDKIAGWFGGSLDGAQATAQLKILQANLMTNMPRMEGPQSDRDVQLYREAAGELGDPTVPRGTKKAAIQTIRALQQKYEDKSVESSGQAKRKRYNPQTGKIE